MLLAAPMIISTLYLQWGYSTMFMPISNNDLTKVITTTLLPLSLRIQLCQLRADLPQALLSRFIVGLFGRTGLFAFNKVLATHPLNFGRGCQEDRGFRSFFR